MKRFNPKVIIIVQARMGSTRLPGKSMKMVSERPLISYLLERLRRTKKADEIVVATTTHERDQRIVDFCREEHIPVYRGSEENVLDRYYQAAKASAADVIVRITGDCPLIDPTIVDQVIAFFLKNDYDYASNSLERTFPRGLDTEVFSFEALEQAAMEATSPEDKEHVTPFFYRNPERFNLGSYTCQENLSRHRWTVDTQEDFILISKILTELYPKKPDFHMEDILQLMEENPEWEKINAHVKQKGICECPED